jgi:GWxTD domain-containing protein
VGALAAVILLGGCAGGGSGSSGPAIDLTSTVPAPETFDDVDLEHLRWALTGEEQEVFLALPVPEREEFMRVRWAALDPTPTTPENERRREHYQRLAYAREHFARDEPPGWDRRGELLLRYGAPDQRREISGDVIPGLGLVPPKEIWIYTWLRLAFELEDAMFQGDFQDAHGRRQTTREDILVDRSNLSRPEPPGLRTKRDEIRVRSIDELAADAEEPPAHAWGPYQPVDAEEEFLRERLLTMVSKGQVALDEKRQAFHHDYGGEQLEFAFDVVNFSAKRSGLTRLEVHTAFRAEDLGYVPEGGGQSAVLGSSAVVKTRDYRTVARRDQVSRPRQESLEERTGRLVLDQIVLELEPGKRRLALSVRDSVTSRVGIFDTEIDVRDFSRDRLALSDIQIALDVSSAREGAPFRKGGLQVVPFPLSTFPKERDIYLYFEIYGLTPSPEGNRLYTVEFMVRPRTVKTSSWFGSSRGQIIPGVATSYDGESEATVVQEYFAFDTRTFVEDLYDVEITVIDRISERKTVRRVSFAVQE